MKKYLIGLGILASIAPFGAMHSQAPKTQETGVTELVEKYMNTTVSSMLLRLSAYFADKSDVSTRTTRIVHELIDTVKFGIFPLAVRNNPHAKIEDFFDVEKIKLFFKKLWEHHEKKKLGARKFHVYIKHFRKTLRLDEIAKKLSKQEADDVDKFLKAARDYYKNNRDGANIDNFISFDRLPSFLRTMIGTYTNLDKLKLVLNNMLNGQPITKELILDLMSFKPVLKEFNCPDEKRDFMEQGLRGICALLFEAAQNDTLAAEHFMLYIGSGYTLARAEAQAKAQNEAPRPAASSSSVRPGAPIAPPVSFRTPSRLGGSPTTLSIARR